MAEEQVEVASAEVTAARARLQEARSILGKYEAEVTRWDIQVKRIEREVERQVIAPQILLESRNELNADIAAHNAQTATIKKADAELVAAEARLSKAEVNVAAANAMLAVARSDAKRMEALVGYLKLFAPFDGIVVARNANTWDFVLPRTGDPTALDCAVPICRLVRPRPRFTSSTAPTSSGSSSTFPSGMPTLSISARRPASSSGLTAMNGSPHR